MKILFIEDDPDYRAALRAGIEPYLSAREDQPSLPDMEIVETEDKEEAEGVLREQSEDIAVAFVDLVLKEQPAPGKDPKGVLLLEHIQHHYPRIVPIVLTGHGNIKTESRCLEAGAFDFLDKAQMDGETIFLRIRRALDEHYRRAARHKMETALKETVEQLRGMAAKLDGLLNQL
jgi:DNA-binding NtrC family response regulator